MNSNKKIFNLLKENGIKVSAWLSENEITEIESYYNFNFPIDYIDIIKEFFPIWEKFPDWRNYKNSLYIQQYLIWPLEGILFDIKYNDFWYDWWWEAPKTLDKKFVMVKNKFREVPKLIPIFGHRYIVDWRESWKQVLSVYQTDIIFYWNNIFEWFFNEFWKKELNIVNEIFIPFWSDIINSY